MQQVRERLRLTGILPFRWCITIGRCTATVVLVRHADITSVAGNPDPPLNAAGTARADALRRALADAGVGAIFVTRFQRTRQTAQPLADALGIEPAIRDDVGETVAAIREQASSSTVLVVGHTNTLPDICAGLGGPALPAIGATEFDRLFVLTRRRLTHLRYGA